MRVLDFDVQDLILDKDFIGRAKPVSAARINDMVESMERVGQVTPVIGIVEEDGPHPRDGWCRIRAIQAWNARRASQGLEPVKIRFIDEEGEVDSTLVEARKFVANTVRTNLNSIDRLCYINRQLEKGLTQAEVGKILGLTRNRINQLAKLKDLIPEATKLVEQEKLAIDAAYALAFSDAPAQKTLLVDALARQNDEEQADIELGEIGKLKSKHVLAAIKDAGEDEVKEQANDGDGDSDGEGEEKEEKAESPTLTLKQFLAEMTDVIESEMPDSLAGIVAKANVDFINKAIRFRAFESRLDKAMERIAAAAEAPLLEQIKALKTKKKDTKEPDPSM